MERVPYEALRDTSARSRYLQGTLLLPPPQALEELLRYISFTREALEAVGFDPEEATRTSADTVFESVSEHIRSSGTTATLHQVQAIDATIRELCEIDSRTNPAHHDNPIVASFFTSLEGHLNRNTMGDRFDSWGGGHI